MPDTAAPRVPLVVLCTVDDWRFDAVNHQPDRRYWQAMPVVDPLETPAIDGFAAESMCFLKTVAAAGYTPLSHATLFTGTYAKQHGVVDFWRTRCREEVMTAPEMFANAGYRTVLFTTDGRQMLFCDQNQSLRRVDHKVSTLEELRQLLVCEPWKPTLLVVHWLEVHDPLVRMCDDSEGLWEFKLLVRLAFNGRMIGEKGTDVRYPDGRELSYWNALGVQPEDARGIRERIRMLFNAYLHTVEKFDATRFKPFIELLRSLPAWKDAVMVLTADHGEIQSHTAPWRVWHGAGVEEQLVRVPLMIRAPGLGHKTMTPLVGLVDMLPTLLDICGLDAVKLGMRQAFDGKSLLPMMTGQQQALRDYWLEGFFMDPNDPAVEPHIISRAIRCPDGKKYIHHGDIARWDDIEAMSFEAFADFVSRCAFLAPASSWFQDRVREQLAAGTRRGELLAGYHGCGRPACAVVDNVDADISESQPLLVDRAHPRWGEYEQRLQRMLAMTATPNESSGLSSEQEAKLADHLGSLGYIE